VWIPIRGCSPGRPFGQLVAILNSRMPCEIAGTGKLAAAPPRKIMPRRVSGRDELLFNNASRLRAYRRLVVRIEMMTLPFSLTLHQRWNWRARCTGMRVPATSSVTPGSVLRLLLSGTGPCMTGSAYGALSVEVSGCCARATSGHVTAPPITLMRSRRRMLSPAGPIGFQSGHQSMKFRPAK